MSFSMNKPLLMIPGPMDVPDEVARRCGMPVFPHYEGDFPAFYHQLVDKMKTVFGLSSGRVYIPNGSGTIAVNMMLASMCTANDEVLVVNNGHFGKYAEKNLVNLGIPHSFVDGPHGTAIDPDAVRNAMKEKRRPFLYVTHNESSTAIVNPLPPMGEIAREFDALLLVDSISAVGGVVIDMDSSGADVVAGASQKCLELPPGIAPVAVSDRALDYMRSMKDRRVPYILDFLAWEKALEVMHDYHPQPVTGATNMLYALDWVADNILEEGLVNRQERFRTAGNRLKNAMAEIGFLPGADPVHASPVVSEILVPDSIDAQVLRDYYMREHNIMVGGSRRADEDGRTMAIRIAHFGVAAEQARIDLMIDITRQFADTL